MLGVDPGRSWLLSRQFILFVYNLYSAPGHEQTGLDVFVKIIKIFILGAVVWDLFTTRTQAKIIEIVGQTL